MNPKVRRRMDVGTGPLWVSNNKVLNGPKKPHARNPNFDAEETKILISLWGDPKVQKTLITTHKKQPVIAQIAEKMRDFGYHRSTEEINTRIKNLKCFYNRTKKELDSGEINMTLWRHYEAMDEIMTRPIFGNIGTQLEYQNIYDAKRKMSSVEPTDHLQIISNDSNDDELTVKEELPSDEEIDNSEVVMQLLMQAKVLAREKKAQEKAEAEAKAQGQSQGTENGDLVVPKLEPMDEALEEVTITKASSTTNTSTSMPALTITSVATKTRDAGKTTTDASVTSSVPQSKISLVPTNVLLKPQTQQPAPTVSYQQPKFIIQNSSPATSVAGSQAMQPMQLVFLQTPPTSNNGASLIGSVANSLPSLATVTTTTPSRPPLPILKPKPAPTTQTVQYTVQQNGQTPQNYSQANGHARPMQPGTATQNGTNRRESTEKSFLKKLETDASPNGEKKGLGFRSLLYQLVKLQNNNLIVNRQRLSVERQRLNVERTLGEQIVNSLQVLTKVFAPVLANEQSMTNGAHKPAAGPPRAKRARMEKQAEVEVPSVDEEDDDADYDEDDDNMSGCD